MHSRMALYTYFPDLLKDIDIPIFYSPDTTTGRHQERVYNNKYFLLVSANRWDKNNLRAIIALDKLFSKGYLKDFEVKVTGIDSYKKLKHKIACPERFCFYGYVGHDELQQLYSDAYCLIYPSLNEGFGYPPLEAMSYGVPVISSSFSSIPEICDNASLYFNPFCIEEIENRILQISIPSIHNKYAKRSIEQQNKISMKQKEDLDKLIDFIYDDMY